MAETSFYESFGVATIEKDDEGIKSFKLNRGLFVAGEFLNEIPTRIHVLPKPGVYTHAIYGKVEVTRERNQEFVDNFHNEVWQKLIPIDLEHETFLSGAVGYYEPGSGIVEGDGSVSIGVRWEERGAKALSEGRFYYFSPMWFDKWKEPLSGKVYNNVLIGGALTTSPYFKDANLRPLYASELKTTDVTVNQVHVDGPMDEEKNEKPDDETKEASSKCPSCGATMAPDAKVCSACGKKMSSEPEKENKVTEEGTQAPVVTVDPAQFSDLQRQFAEMQKQMADRDAELKVAREQIARSAMEARSRKFKEIITGTNQEADGAKAFRGDVTVHAGVLDAIFAFEGEEGIEKEDSLFKRYTAEMRSLAEQLADNELIKTRGGTGGREPNKGSATEKWNAEVAKVMSENKVDQNTAYNIVAKNRPDLYNAQREENYAKKGELD